MNKEEQAFKEMLNKLRKTTKMSELMLELQQENKLLEKELKQCKDEKAIIQSDLIVQIKRYTELRVNIEIFMKREAISFMKMFRYICDDMTFTDEIQSLVNNFIYKLTHGIYLSSRN